VERDREAIDGVGRGAASALRVHELAGRRVVFTASSTSARLGLSVPTVNAAFARLEEAGILQEVSSKRRCR
jgi:Fic family protein